MSSIGSSFAQRKQKKMLTTGTVRIWTSAQILTALNLVPASSLSLIGVSSLASTTNVTDDNLGSSAIVATDANLATILANSGSGLSAVSVPSVSTGELLRPLGKKFTLGTQVYSDLLTFQKVQRTDMGTTQTQGVGLESTTGDGYNTYWVLTDSFARSGGSHSVINGLAAATVLVIAV